MGNGKKTAQHKDLFSSVEQKSTLVELSNACAISSRCNDEMKTVLLPKILKKLMQDKNLSVRQLAKDCKLPVSTISSYLSGKKSSYSPEHLECLADFFGVSIDYLLFGKNPNASLNSVFTEPVFNGWLKVTVERAVPSKKKTDATEED